MEVDESQEEDFMKKREREARRQQGEEILEELAKRMTLAQKIEVVEAMWSQGIDIPDFFEDSIASENQVTQLLKVYLSDSRPKIDKVLKLIAKNDPRKLVEEVASVDLQFLVLLLENLSESKLANQAALDDL